MRTRTLMAALLAGALALPLGAAAATSTGDRIEDSVFSEVERQIMERYFHEERHERSEDGDRDEDGSRKHGKKDKKGKGSKGGKQGLPPGLAKRDSLPPGLAKRETLPPGLEKRALPEDLERRLPPPRKGTERLLVEGAAVLVEKATGKVLDILEDAIDGK